MNIIKVSQQDLKIPIEITLDHDCVNQLIIAEVYSSAGILLGDVTAIKPITGNPFPEGLAVGGLKGTKVTVRCNFKFIESGGEYSIVFRTNGTGVVSKSILFVFNKSAVYIDEKGKCKPVIPKFGLVTNGDGTKFLADDGTYKSISGSFITKEISFIWTEDMGYVFAIDDFNAMHEFKIGGISYPQDLGFFDTDQNLIVVNTDFVEFKVGDIVTIQYYPAEQTEGDDDNDNIFQDEFQEEFE